MAAPPVPVLCSASPCRVTTHLAPPAFRTVTVARPQALPFVLSVEQRVGPSARARAPFAAKRGGGGEVSAEAADGTRALLQAALWGAEAAYILWLFLLPYAPVSKSVPVPACICVPNYELKRCHHRVPRDTSGRKKKKESVASISIFVQGDPVWAISQATISDLIGLSLNFFFVLPLLNSGTLKPSKFLMPKPNGFFSLSLSQSYCGRDSVGEFSWAV